MDRSGACRRGVALTPTAALSIRRSTSAEAGDQSRPEALARDAGRLLAACGVHRSRAWISRIVRDYASSIAGTGFPFGAYLLNRVEMNAEQRRAAMNDPEVAYLLEYADPTGETAVRNVLRGAGHGRD